MSPTGRTDGPGGWAAYLIHNGHLLGLALALILVSGLAAWGNLPRVEDPRITTRNALVITPLPGGDAARVESLVTKPLEDALREVAEITTIESTSRAGVSLISLELDDAVGPDDNQAIFAKIRDRLAAAEGSLPAGAGKPTLDDLRGAVAYSLVAAVAWEGTGGEPPMGILGRLSDDLADRLRNLPGTEQVVRFGAAEEELRVVVDGAELAALGLGLQAVAARLAGADSRLPAGTLRHGDSRIQIEVAGAFDTAARVSAVPLVADRGRVATLGDFARVSRTWTDPPAEMAYSNGRRAVLIGARTRDAIHLDDWSRAARAVVADFAPRAGEGITVETVFDQNRYTETRLAQLGGNLLGGAAVIVLVVLLTMGLRAALVVGAALPLSAALTLFGLDLAGAQIHQMSIFGLIIAIGLLIDNAVVITDEVRRHRAQGLAPDAAASAAVAHLFTPLAASTFTTILGFMPIFLLSGNIGDFVGPIAVSVNLALAVSFALSMTLIPALAARFAPPALPGERVRWWRQGWSSPALAAGYRALLGGALRRPALTLVVCLILPGAGLWAAGQLGNQFFPAADRDQFEIQVWLGPDAEVTATAARVRAMEDLIRASGEVRGVTWVIGGSSPPVYYNQLRDQDANPAYARGTVLAADTAEAKRLVGTLQDRLSDAFPDARIVVRPFGQGPPSPAPVAMRLVGPDPDTLRELGERLRLLLAEQPEITFSRASIEGGAPKLWLDVHEAEARQAGLSLADIAGQFQAALSGQVGGRVLEDLEELPVRVRLSDGERGDTARVATLRLVAPPPTPGAPPLELPAEALGELRLAPQAGAITRRDGERVNTVFAWVRPDALPIEVTAAVRARIAAGALPLPTGYRMEVAGDSEESGEAIGRLLAYAPLLGTLMVATLVLSFRSFVIAGIITLSGILSVALGFLCLWLGGYPLGFNPLLGSAGLLGVAINASIVVLAAIRAHPQASAGDPDALAATVLRATRHIVTTTLTTVVGFLPLLLSGGDFWPPLAVVIAGGVGLSAFLGLFFTPALYRLAVPRLAAEPGAAMSPSPTVAT